MSSVLDRMNSIEPVLGIFGSLKTYCVSYFPIFGYSCALNNEGEMEETDVKLLKNQRKSMLETDRNKGLGCCACYNIRPLYIVGRHRLHAIEHETQKGQRGIMK